MAIRSTTSRSPYRIQAGLSSSPSTTPGNYVVTRTDGGAYGGSVLAAWLVPGDALHVALALDEPMLDGVSYTLAVSGHGSALVGYRSPQVGVAAPPSDPEAEVYGVDLCRIAAGVGADGDLVRRKGLDAAKNDYACQALIAPGELVHRPTEGAGLALRVNGPAMPGELTKIATDCKRQWLSDPRTEGVAVAVTATSGGEVSVNADIRTTPTPAPIRVTVRD